MVTAAPREPGRKPGSQILTERFPNAIELWAVVVKRPGTAIVEFAVTAYSINGHVVILQEFTDQRAGSWDVYVQASESAEIEATLAAVERRVVGEIEDPRARELHDACTGVAHAFSSVRAEVDQALRERGGPDNNAAADELDAAYTRWQRACEALLSGVRP